MAGDGLDAWPLALWLYLFIDGSDAIAGHHHAKPHWQGVMVSTHHCGSGRTLGGIIASG